MLRTMKATVGDTVLGGLKWTIANPSVSRRIFHQIASGHGSDQDGPNDSLGERLEFMSYCHANRRFSNSQVMQDLWVQYELRGLLGGYFVEFGAVDGVVHSNSLALEKVWQWSGLLAEPNPVFEVDLRTTRSAAIDMRCVWSSSGDSIDFLVTEDAELATVVGYEGSDLHACARKSGSARTTVETVSLVDLLRQHQCPARIDYMSIDTEGTELEILSAFDFDAFDVRLFSIEHNNRPDRKRLIDLMGSRGYDLRFPELSDFDAWFRKRD
jgi:FkbM family methyltransferase